MKSELIDFRKGLERFGEKIKYSPGRISYFIFEDDFDRIPYFKDNEKIPDFLRKLGINSVVKIGEYKFGKEKYSLREILSTGEIREKSVENLMERPSCGRSVFEQVLRENPKWARELGLYPSYSIYQ
ncbi:MAG: hypothetical protein KAT37_02510 [Candidatus Aenigmarchaeota archaeon]|nr:hypothetical protein [Candidatus Aenigmarchaeota archaeon]